VFAAFLLEVAKPVAPLQAGIIALYILRQGGVDLLEHQADRILGIALHHFVDDFWNFVIKAVS
jgi:hypothetical protein